MQFLTLWLLVMFPYQALSPRMNSWTDRLWQTEKNPWCRLDWCIARQDQTEHRITLDENNLCNSGMDPVVHYQYSRIANELDNQELQNYINGIQTQTQIWQIHIRASNARSYIRLKSSLWIAQGFDDSISDKNFWAYKQLTRWESSWKNGSKNILCIRGTWWWIIKVFLNCTCWFTCLKFMYWLTCLQKILDTESRELDILVINSVINVKLQVGLKMLFLIIVRKETIIYSNLLLHLHYLSANVNICYRSILYFW